MTPTATGTRPFYAGVDTLGFADRPHQVHKNALATELRKRWAAR